MKPQKFDYTPPGTLTDFFRSDKRVRFVRGPIGSAKSTAMVMELFRRTCQQPRASDGLRYTRFVIVRNTLQQIKETCLQTVYKCIRPLVYYKVSDQKLLLNFNDIRSEWILLPLDTPDNINKLLSLEITGGWVSEAREIDPEIVHNVLSRCGRYPSALMGLCDWHGIIAESNSFSEDSPWYALLEQDLPTNWGYFIQPGARDPQADWLQYLLPTYYDDLLESNRSQGNWVDQYIDNKIGPSLSGQAVYAQIFDRKFHISASAGPLTPSYLSPIVIGMDTGRHPAAVTTQIDARGRLLILSSIHGDNMGMEKFVKTVLVPHLTERFHGPARYFIAVDPAARQRSQIGEESVRDALKRLGFSVIIAPTNNISPRLRAVERYLSTQIDGGAGFLVDPHWNAVLIRGFLHDYRFQRVRSGELKEIPEKNHPASDLHDALQYACLCVNSSTMARELHPQQTVVAPPPISGWT